MTIEEIIDSRPIQFTGWSAVLLMIFGNLARLLTHMNVNDILLLISSIIGLFYLVLKTVTAFYTAIEKIEEAKERKRKKKDSDA